MQQIADFEMSRIVLANVMRNNTYATKVLPYFDQDTFVDTTEKAISDSIIKYNEKYGKVPTPQELVVEIKDLPFVTQLDKNIVNEIWNQSITDIDQEWLEDNTEKFIRRRRVSKAFEETYSAFDTGQPVDDFSQIFQEAVAFCFDNSVGHSFVNDVESRWEMYTVDDDRIPFALNMFNKVTNGGMPKGTLNCILAGTGVGKSLFMCSDAATQAKLGNKVLYISMEMAELRIAERIEANLINVNLSELKDMPEEEFKRKQKAVVDDMKGNGGDIIFKQYPTGTAGAGNFRNLIVECKNKLGYDFDLIYVDYLGICKPMSGLPNDNSYTKVKAVAEELRALSIMFNVPIVTAAQTNRGGQGSSSLSLEDVAESHGLSVTVDMFFAMISTDEFESQGKILFQQLKNRYGALNWYNKFVVGLDRSKMRLYDISEEASKSHNVDPSPTKTVDVIDGLDLGTVGVKRSPVDLGALNTKSEENEVWDPFDGFQIKGK